LAGRFIPAYGTCREELKLAIENTRFQQPSCHVYQNVVAKL
jgi:hypothetical protein